MDCTDKPLTKRELEILKLVCKGFSNKEIGKELWISYHTVKSHISVIINKLGARNRTEVAYIAAKEYLFEDMIS